MPRNYYCLVAGLPNISLDDSKLNYSADDLFEEVKEFIHEDDIELFNLFRYKTDNKNLYEMMIEHSGDFIKGVYSRDQLEEFLTEPEKTVDYMKEFIREFYDEDFDREVNMKRLIYLYYRHISKTSNEFVKEWFNTEINLKNIFAALNCRKYGLSPEDEIVKYNFVSDALINSSSRDFGLSAEYPLIENVLNIFEEDNLIKRERTLDVLKWEWLDENTFFKYFTVEKLISYYIKLEIIERWIKLDPATGKEFFEKLIQDLKSDYEFPEEFKIKKIKNK